MKRKDLLQMNARILQKIFEHETVCYNDSARTPSTFWSHLRNLTPEQREMIDQRSAEAHGWATDAANMYLDPEYIGTRMPTGLVINADVIDCFMRVERERFITFLTSGYDRRTSDGKYVRVDKPQEQLDIEEARYYTARDNLRNVMSRFIPIREG